MRETFRTFETKRIQTRRAKRAGWKPKAETDGPVNIPAASLSTSHIAQEIGPQYLEHPHTQQVLLLQGYMSKTVFVVLAYAALVRASRLDFHPLSPALLRR